MTGPFSGAEGGGHPAGAPLTQVMPWLARTHTWRLPGQVALAPLMPSSSSAFPPSGRVAGLVRWSSTLVT